MLEISRELAELGNETEEVFRNIIASGNFILGDEVDQFEKEFAKFSSVPHCIGVSSGTDALEVSLKALEIGPGDKVIVPAVSFIATAFAVSMQHAIPIFVDIDLENGLMDVNKALDLLDPGVKAIIPVHLYGQALDISALVSSGLPVIEDAAQAHGAKSNGSPVGSNSTCACFSFYPSKNLGALGDAGAIVTSDPLFRDKICSIRNYGRSKEYVHDQIGRNARIDTLQAAVLKLKLKHLARWTKQREITAKRYDNELNPNIPKITKGGVRHLYVIRSKKREKFREMLLESGIETGCHYPVPLPFQPCYNNLPTDRKSFPAAELLTKEILSLPVHPFLLENEIDYVIEKVNKTFAKLG